MESTEITEIPIENLRINIENPRFKDTTNQREAIKIMVDRQGEKLFNLAEDISKSGLNPSDLTMVIREDIGSSLFTVLEGNRRITAIKLLSNPELLDVLSEAKFKTIKKKFLNLAKTFDSDLYNNIKCVVFENRDEANHWIFLKHTGENEGTGTVRWDTPAQEKFIAKVGGRTPLALQAIEFIKKVTDDEELKKRLDEVKPTNLTRLLEDPTVRKTIGINKIDGELQTDLMDSEVKKGLIQIGKDITDPNFKVNDIYYKKDRLKYIKKFPQKSKPDKTKLADSSWALTSYDKKEKPKLGKKKKAPLSTSRKYVIPDECILIIEKPKRINDVYVELRKLDVDKFPNASGILVRVFLELCLDKYIKSVKLANVKESDSLKRKINKVKQDLLSKKLLSQKDLKSIDFHLSDENSLLHMTTLHAYVHNMNFSPIPDNLKLTWDNIQEFVEILWDEINEKR